MTLNQNLANWNCQDFVIELIKAAEKVRIIATRESVLPCIRRKMDGVA